MHEPLPLRPEDVPPAFTRAFNRGDLDFLLALYGEGSLLAASPERQHRGADIRPALRAFMREGATLHVHTRRCLIAGDVALLVLDWSIEGASDDDGGPLAGTAADVVLRRPDGTWGYGIDNPFGVL